jgi:hypothetical protein
MFMNSMEDRGRNPRSRPWTSKTRENPGSRPWTFVDCEYQLRPAANSGHIKRSDEERSLDFTVMLAARMLKGTVSRYF